MAPGHSGRRNSCRPCPRCRTTPCGSRRPARQRRGLRADPEATRAMTNAILTGLMLGGMYALIAMGLTLQYGVARIMNLSYGELLIAAAFASHWLFTALAVSPFIGLVLIVP